MGLDDILDAAAFAVGACCVALVFGALLFAGPTLLAILTLEMQR